MVDSSYDVIESCLCFQQPRASCLWRHWPGDECKQRTLISCQNLTHIIQRVGCVNDVKTVIFPDESCAKEIAIFKALNKDDHADKMR